jgi:dTDP-4-amino-4,6-dideoxygalactose transaminase
MERIKVPFNKPFLTGSETEYVKRAVESGTLSGNGIYTKRCQKYFEERYGFGKVLLTTSCTDALEMAAILCGVEPGDEVIVPSYTFVSSALAFVRQGAKIVFADSRADEPNMDVSRLEALITPKTKVIVPVHYAGVACDMDAVMNIATRHGIFVVEDAAQAVDSFYTGRDGRRRALGSIGHFGCFSFHETKNIISGEGGMLVVNDMRFAERAEIIWEKGTNRSQFYRGEVDKYGWVDVGSSFLPSEVVAAFLWAQLENLDVIQERRLSHVRRYREFFGNVAADLGCALPFLPDYATNNAHMFYLVFDGLKARTDFICAMKERGIHAVFHYLSLHSSPYGLKFHDGRVLPNADRFADGLVRLPMFFDLIPATVESAVSDLLSKGRIVQ